MGKKDDRIEGLEADLADTRALLTAAKFLLRRIGDDAGVDLCEDLSMQTAPRNLQKFLRGAARGTASLEPGRRRQASGSWDTYDDEVDEQIDRMDAQGLTKPREPSAALVSSGSGPDDDLADLRARASTVTQAAPTILAIASELGLEVGSLAHDEALAAIHAEIIRVKSMGSDTEAEASSKFLAKGDSLGQAIAHHHAQNEELREGVTQARTIVARLAAVMQVDKWDKDGTELLEHAQRWEGLKHELKRRIRDLRDNTIRGIEDINLRQGVENEAIADELQSHLDRLMSRKEMTDFLKAAPGKPAAKVAIHEPYPFTFRGVDTGTIWNALLRGETTPRGHELESVFSDISNSRTAADELARVMNVVILPILARQKAAQRVPQDAPTAG
jgi:hypothetical protein